VLQAHPTTRLRCLAVAQVRRLPRRELAVPATSWPIPASNERDSNRTVLRDDVPYCEEDRLSNRDTAAVRSIGRYSRPKYDG
jgi:hypothetical protein